MLFLEVPESRSTALYYAAARSLDLVPVLVTRYRAAEGDIADRLHVSNMDVATILSAVDQIGRERIAGVFAHADYTAEPAARVAAALDRPHADPKLISLCNDKHRLRDFLARSGLNTVDYHHATTVAEAQSAAEKFGGAVVVKPLSSSGSDGVRICRTSNQAALYAQRLLKSQPQGILIERYIDAPQYGIDFFDGIPLIFKRYHIHEGPFPIIEGVDLPAPPTTDCLTELRALSRSIIEEVGLVSGPAFMEFRYSDNKIYIIEINPRISLHGPVQLPIMGIDISALCIQFSCNLHYEVILPDNYNSKFCVTRHELRNFYSINSIKGIEEAKKIAGVKRIATNDPHFNRRGPVTCTLDRIFTVYTEANNIELAIDSANIAMSKIDIIYEKNIFFFIQYYLKQICGSIINFFTILRLKILGA